VERVEVLHRELVLESCSDTLEKLWAQGGEDDVVDFEQQVSSVGVRSARQTTRCPTWPPRSPTRLGRWRNSGTTLTAPASGCRGTC
jgi:hypothetical protein